MKSRFVFIVLVIASGCDLFPYDDFRYSPQGIDASILVSYELVSYNSNEIVYDVRLASFNYYNDLYYEVPAYTLEGPGTLEILQIEGRETISNSASSNVVLIDQSGSYAEVDPHNLRTKIVNKFLDDFSPPDNLLLGAFSSQGLLPAQPVEYASANFNAEWVNQGFLFDLPKLTGGSCPLYDAIHSAIGKLESRSEPNKNIIVLTHANDEGSTTAISELIDKAKIHSIKIFIVALGPEPEPSALWDLNSQSGGMMALCPQDLHMVTILNHLGRLIKGSVYTSRLRISFKPATGEVLAGNIYENQIKIVDPYTQYEFNPVYIKIKIP